MKQSNYSKCVFLAVLSWFRIFDSYFFHPRHKCHSWLFSYFSRSDLILGNSLLQNLSVHLSDLGYPTSCCPTVLKSFFSNDSSNGAFSQEQLSTKCPVFLHCQWIPTPVFLISCCSICELGFDYKKILPVSLYIEGKQEGKLLVYGEALMFWTVCGYRAPLITRKSSDFVSNPLGKSQDGLWFYSVSSSWQLTCLKRNWIVCDTFLWTSLWWWWFLILFF